MACSNVRDILNKYRGPEAKHVPTSWLDEIEGIEAKKQEAAEPVVVNENDKTVEGFSDIDLIRRKYLGVLGDTKKSASFQGTGKFDASGGSRKASSGNFEGSASRKNNNIVDASIDNLLHTLKSTKKQTPPKPSRVYDLNISQSQQQYPEIGNGIPEQDGESLEMRSDFVEDFEALPAPMKDISMIQQETFAPLPPKTKDAKVEVQGEQEAAENPLL